MNEPSPEYHKPLSFDDTLLAICAARELGGSSDCLFARMLSVLRSCPQNSRGYVFQCISRIMTTVDQTHALLMTIMNLDHIEALPIALFSVEMRSHAERMHGFEADELVRLLKPYASDKKKALYVVSVMQSVEFEVLTEDLKELYILLFKYNTAEILNALVLSVLKNVKILREWDTLSVDINNIINSKHLDESYEFLYTMALHKLARHPLVSKEE
jgi:hypothetical protein